MVRKIGKQPPLKLKSVNGIHYAMQNNPESCKFVYSTEPQKIAIARLRPEKLDPTLV